MKKIIRKKGRKRKSDTQSKTSPKGGTRGCLCDDNTYHPDCCDGTIYAQGVGKIQRKPNRLKIIRFIKKGNKNEYN